MALISPRLGEILIKTTHSNNFEDAFHKIFSDYLELKLKSLKEKSKQFQTKWKLDFEEFKKKTKEGGLAEQPFSYDVEKDFWEWEESESLIHHYQDLKNQWI